ncbi:hypothetical protein MY11210_009710 [Beauveria gryllotalpidicola]
MSRLSPHLEQISYSCQGIDSLPFPPPKIFTNALLSAPDITSLIRDTEPHERALFSVPPPPPPPAHTKRAASVSASDDAKPAAKRRQTVFNVTTTGDVTTGGGGGGSSTRAAAQPRKHTAVAAVLGGAMHERLREDRRGGAVVDVEVLLRGAETLCGVYELPGARERIASLRAKYRNGRETVEYYEGKVAEQGAELASQSRNWMAEGEEEEEEDEEEGDVWTEEDLKREEEEAREMETKKRVLQTRLRNMEKDLGGLKNT